MRLLLAIAGVWCALSVLVAVAWAYAHRHAPTGTVPMAAWEQQLLRTYDVEDAANVWRHDYGDALPETWLLLDVEADR